MKDETMAGRNGFYYRVIEHKPDPRWPGTEDLTVLRHYRRRQERLAHTTAAQMAETANEGEAYEVDECEWSQGELSWSETVEIYSAELGEAFGVDT